MIRNKECWKVSERFGRTIALQMIYRRYKKQKGAGEEGNEKEAKHMPA